MTAKLVEDFAKINAELSARRMEISPAIAATIRHSLRASLSLATSEFFADLPNAQRHAAEIAVALEWLAEQECLTVLSTTESEPVYAGPIVHEGQRWPVYGANRRKKVWEVEQP